MKVRRPVEPEFPGRWAHRAERRRIRRDLRSRNGYLRRKAQLNQHLWAYKDARVREDEAAAEAAWQAYRRERQRQAQGGSGFDWYAASDSVRLAVGLGDLDRAAAELLAWYEHVDTRHTGTDNLRRTAARSFVSACISLLEREASLDHCQSADVDARMRDVAVRIEPELMPHHQEGFWRIGELRAWAQVARASGRLVAALQPPDAAGVPAPPPQALAASAPPTAGEPARRRQQEWQRLVAAAGRVAEQARLAAAWTAWAVQTRDPDLAAEAYQRVLGLVPLVVAERPEGSDRQRLLAAAQEHTEEAGYWLARTGRYREAAVVLEAGRAVELSQTVSQAHDLPGRSARDLAYADILAGAGDGALVYLAAATAGGYALVVAARHDPQFVELPKLDRRSAEELLGALLPGARAGSAPVTSSALRQPVTRSGQRDAAALDESGDLLADRLAKLFDNGLRLLYLFVGGRVATFLPVGLLGLLPLHAAGAPADPRYGGPDWRQLGSATAMRYAPNARSLIRCRETARKLAAEPLQLLAVAVPDGFGVDAMGYLHYVEREAAEVVRRWGRPAATRTGSGSWEEFRAAAHEYAVWHLACHGSARPTDILDSRLYFMDRAVPLRELREVLPAGRRRLAVLSACESNLTDASMPNEVVGLPSALLQLGFAGVIASSWKVDDLATAYLMTAFYRQWRGYGQEPAVALNLAQRWLRTATRPDLTALLPGVTPGGGDGEVPYRHPRYWAAFAYTGA